MNGKDNKSAYISAVVYATITGLSFIFTKFALEYSNPLDILAHRFTASFIAIVITISIKKIDIKYSKDKIKKVIPLAILYPLLFFGFQTFGLKSAPSSEAGILLASAPVFTLILASYILKEKTNLLQKLSVLLSVSGVAFIFIMKGSTSVNLGSQVNSMLGIILLTLTALCFAGYSVLARILTKSITNFELSYIMIGISFVSFNLIALSQHFIKGEFISYITPLMNFKYIVSILYLGVLSSLVTSMLTNYILSKIEASKMSVFTNLGTVISILSGAIILSENIFYYHIIGSVLIIGGVLGTNFLGGRIKDEVLQKDNKYEKKQ